MRTLLAYRKYAFYLLTLVPSLSFGQQRLTLNEAIETALKNSLDIQISKKTIFL
ncbi:hypothetical protein ACFFJX_29800 [Pseudarcicella hirudinis]|uniref:hypothetical protein n=1 Tax=Pseudarcicella hirudinis TaxID=1079859 RepID=UPI0035EEF9B1